MRRNLTTLFALLALSSVALTGCDDGDGGTDSGPGNDAGPVTNDDAGPGPTDAGPGPTDAGPGGPMARGMANPPTLGNQIDRAGRPAVSSALIGTFTIVDDAMRDAAKNAYNEDSDPSMWAANYTDDIANNLGVLDGVDRNCGNQLAAGATDAPERYDALAGVLAADYLLIDTTDTACPEYLGVEAEALGVVPDGGCGGRRPTADIIERSYSVLVAGALSGIDDGITSDDATHSDDTFPFLAAPL